MKITQSINQAIQAEKAAGKKFQTVGEVYAEDSS